VTKSTLCHRSLVIILRVLFLGLLLLLRSLAVVDPVLVAVVRLVLAPLLGRDRSRASLDVLVDLVIDLRAAVSVVGIASGIEELARVRNVLLDDAEFLDGNCGRLVLPWEDAWLDDLGKDVNILCDTRKEGERRQPRTSEMT
jgi:hypothetical protein